MTTGTPDDTGPATNAAPTAAMTAGTATPPPGPAAARWAERQRGRGLPQEIRAAAPADPWRHDARDFAPPEVPADTPSRRMTLELLGESGTLIDVGCGGGDAAFAVAGAAAHLTGVDRQQDMLDAFAAEAGRRGVECTTVLGAWPDVAPAAGRAHVVVCHHVLHNVVDLPPFLRALSAAAGRGVVVEMLTEHPMAWLDPLFEGFHGLRRPVSATHEDAVAVLGELGITPEVVTWERTRTPPHDAAWVTRRLCLGPERVPDVAEALVGLAPRTKWAATLRWRV